MIIKISFKIILLVGIIGLVGYFSTDMHIEWLKYATVLLQLYLIVFCIKTIISNKKRVIWRKALPILAFLTIYPFLSILFDNSNLDFKQITDGFFVRGIYYYQLPIISMALALEITKNKFTLQKILIKYSLYAIPFAIFLIYYSVNIDVPKGNGDSPAGFFSLSNCLIPMCLLAFFYQAQKKYYYLGWLSIVATFIFSTQISARSYLLVCSYLILGLLIFTHRNNRKLLFYIIPIGTIVFIYLLIPSLSLETYTQEDKSSLDTLQLDTLSEAINSFLETFDFSYIFYWEGNSRAGILEDAFSNFTIDQWFFGRGIYATYQSFVERTTIELGWAQDCFYWGVFYVLFTITLFITGIVHLRRQSVVYKNNVFDCLGVLIFVRLLDGFIYGMPEYTIYNLLVFSGVLMQTIKKDSSVRFSK